LMDGLSEAFIGVLRDSSGPMRAAKKVKANGGYKVLRRAGSGFIRAVQNNATTPMPIR